MRTCLACDIGASGGRVITGKLKEERICLREVYRFANGAKMGASALEWDVERLTEELLTGMRMAGEGGDVPDSAGVDTWGADYVLLDEWGVRMDPCVCYRDTRTAGMPERLDDRLSFARHYARTGTALQPFNTVYQLMSESPERIERATDLLMLPDYLHYRLTGLMRSEYTAASTTGLLNVKTNRWDREVLLAAGIPGRLFRPVSLPGTPLGYLRHDVAERLGYTCRVTLPPAHDTASAFLAAPVLGPGSVILSSGTWSLIGVEAETPLLLDEPAARLFTNEGGYDGGKRYLKNIMGLWILQGVRRELGDAYAYEEIARMAAQESAYPGVFDVNDQRLLLPFGMIDTVRALIAARGLPAPENDGQLFAAVLRSLALCYADAVRELARLTGRAFTEICVVGGGSGNDTLNQWTADETGLTVYAGPMEGTACGNILSQLMALGEIPSARAAREYVRASFDIRRFDPR